MSLQFSGASKLECVGVCVVDVCVCVGVCVVDVCVGVWVCVVGTIHARGLELSGALCISH